MTIPALSILLPTYNGEPHFTAQIESILAQSWEDYELLIVDDGSTDSTPAIAAAFAARDPRIRLVESAGSNAGQKARLIQLLRASRAPLISIADQDDVWDRERTRRLIEALGDKALAYGRSDLIDGEGRPLGVNLAANFGGAPEPGDRIALLFTP